MALHFLKAYVFDYIFHNYIVLFEGSSFRDI